jgi:hypothetical protein
LIYPPSSLAMGWDEPLQPTPTRFQTYDHASESTRSSYDHVETVVLDPFLVYVTPFLAFKNSIHVFFD